MEAETGLMLVEEPHFAVLQLVATAIVVQVERGALGAAAELARIGERLALSGNQGYAGDYMTARARLRIAAGDVEAGVADLLWCGDHRAARGQLWPSDWKTFLAPALASLGENLRAAELAREHLAMARRVGAPGALGRALRAAALTIDDGERLALLEEAVSVLDHSPARLDRAHALADLGAELNRRNRRREGREAERSAIKLAGDCGAVALVESAEAELHAGPGRRARTEVTGPNALTAAEWRVCRQAVEGRTNREIAEALFVTEKTIERHLSSAYQKLGIRSRFQLSAAVAQ
jgi:DNA-binding CsgD family transcriptional regulator